MTGNYIVFKMILAGSILLLGFSRICLRNLCGIGRSIEVLCRDWNGPDSGFWDHKSVKLPAIVVVIVWKFNDLAER